MADFTLTAQVGVFTLTGSSTADRTLHAQAGNFTVTPGTTHLVPSTTNQIGWLRQTIQSAGEKRGGK